MDIPLTEVLRAYGEVNAEHVVRIGEQADTHDEQVAEIERCRMMAQDRAKTVRELDRENASLKLQLEQVKESNENLRTMCGNLQKELNGPIKSN